MKSEEELLVEANSIIRSFYMIIKREGKSTNWEALGSQVERILNEQSDFLKVFNRNKNINDVLDIEPFE